MALVFKCDKCGNIEDALNIVKINACSGYFHNRNFDFCQQCYKLLFDLKKSEVKNEND